MIERLTQVEENLLDSLKRKYRKAIISFKEESENPIYCDETGLKIISDEEKIKPHRKAIIRYLLKKEGYFEPTPTFQH